MANPVQEPDFSRSLIETAQAIVLVLDPQGRIVSFNPYMEAVCGYALKEVQGKDWFDTFLPQRDRQRIRALFVNAIADVKTKGNINPIICKGGDERHIEWYDTTLKDAGGAITGLLSIGQDVTERLAIEKNLGIKDAAVDSTHNAVAFADMQGSLTYVNRAFLRLWGYDSAAALYGTHATNYWFEPDEAALVITELNQTGHWKGELTAVRKDGTRFPVEVSANVVMDKHGERLGLMSLFEDISERKRTEQALIAAKEQAEQANEAKSLFLSRMSHELRTPLNSILGFAQLLEMDSDAQKRDNLQHILSSGRHLLNLINELLDLSKIERNKLEFVIGRVDLAASIKDCIDTMLPLARELDIELRCDWGAFHGRIVEADAVRLKQVLLNLLSNAVKYNRSAGSVTVRGEPAGEAFRINVSDTGSGIPTDDLPGLFQPFNRLYLTTYTADGSGIGLALAKQLTEHMGGRIGVQSEPGAGSTFWLEVPLHARGGRPLTSQTLNLENDGAVAGKAHKILYIEDSPSHTKLVQAIFAQHNDIQLLTANTPRLGLELARAHRPDLILLDICLPEMDGYQVFERLRSDADICHIPVIALSAGAMPHEIERGLRCGFRRYLTKPVDIEVLLRAVREVLRDSATLPIID